VDLTLRSTQTVGLSPREGTSCNCPPLIRRNTNLGRTCCDASVLGSVQASALELGMSERWSQPQWEAKSSLALTGGGGVLYLPCPDFLGGSEQGWAHVHLRRAQEFP
jgi:hypothetical protein